MDTKDLVLLAVTLLILAEVSYLLAKLPRTSIKSKDRAILIDTSVLMDGRITFVAATGFISGTLVIPRSVVGELQLLADGADGDKRARARYGLDVINELQKLDQVDVEILQDGSRANEGVDERLLTLAKQHHAVICTLDFNLNKVAAVEGIRVLNINELAQGLRMSYLPGNQLSLDLVQKGQDSHQGVGYLPDGTMVVVEQASAYIGKSVNIEIIRSLQTAAGKMMFAKRVDDKKHQVNVAPVTRPVRGNERHKNTQNQETVARRVAVKRPYRQTASGTAPVAAAHDVTRPPEAADTAPAPETVRAQPVAPARRAARPVETTTKAERSAPQQRSPRPQQRRNNRRKDHEADLIALVDNQS